jgi:hypothetical protein
MAAILVENLSRKRSMKPLIPLKTLPLLGLWKSGQKSTTHFPAGPTTITSAGVSPKGRHLYFRRKGDISTLG